MQAAYPELDAEDTCSQHRHDEPTFALARALAVACQGTEAPDDEQVAWFLDDAGAVVDDFEFPNGPRRLCTPRWPSTWTVTSLGEPEYDDELGEPTLLGIDHRLQINGVEYVVPESEWEPSHPVRRSTWEAERAEAEAEADDEETV